jgi:DNA ligase-1
MYGSVLCAALNAKTGLFQTVCRMGTGFSDTELAGLPARLRDASTAGPSPRVTIAKQIAPHYYFSPRYVLEVLAAEITKSPVHTCGWDEVKKRGFSLRFPRFVRWRPDRSAEETTTVQEITDLYRMQGGKRDETGDADSEQ